jgi:hypothetical protein
MKLEEYITENIVIRQFENCYHKTLKVRINITIFFFFHFFVCLCNLSYFK